ncbi:MAG: 50S ribosomal protein L32e [Candidatus Poseidoniaceae archaeon]
MSDDFSSMTVAQLKELLKERDLPVSGNKKDLIARLEGADEAPAPVEEDSDAPEAPEAKDDAWEDDDWDAEGEDELHTARQKPVLDDATREALALRAAQKAKTPSFRRTEWFRYARLSRSGWRKPKGMDNKQRRNFKYRGSLVRVGHGKVAAARGLHPSGFSEVMVHNVADLDAIDPAVEAARIGSAVGGRKRATIHARADELGIRVLNRRRDA